MFLKDGELVGIITGNITYDVIYSHAGLTYGGIVTNYGMRVQLMVDMFGVLLDYLKHDNIRKLIYKSIQSINHSVPTDEDLYALYRYNAKLIRRDVGSAIYMPTRPVFQTNRTRTMNKALKNALVARPSYDFKTFMGVVENVLVRRYGVKPVHTYEEIEVLAKRFPDQIKLFASYKNDEMLAGVVIYESNNVAHAQYIANSDKGKALGALDLVFGYLISECYPKKRYFDFGISTEDEGRHLNIGLVNHKEGFGASSYVHDFYELLIR